MTSIISKISTAAEQSLISELVAISRRYGRDRDFVVAGGGNTSFKTADRLWVKSSGRALDDITAEGFVEMDRAALETLIAVDLGNDVVVREEKFKQAILAARIHPELGQRPSVECVLHHLLPTPFVVHTHSTVVNMLTCTREAQLLAAKLFDDSILWVPYVDPGFVLAQKLQNQLMAWRKKTGKACPAAVLMANHGLIVCGECADELDKNTRDILTTIEAEIQKTPPIFPVDEQCATQDTANAAQRKAWSNQIANELTPQLDEACQFILFDATAPALGLVNFASAVELIQQGPLIPDQIVYCKSFPLWLTAEESRSDTGLNQRLQTAWQNHRKTTGFDPLVILIEKLGMFCLGRDEKAANIVREMYLEMIKTMAGALRFNGINAMNERERRFIEDWEVEAYRQQIAADRPAAV